ncbi:MAG: DUF4197 domain-containing protein [Azonexus sp.]|nr:DUF4197 domain-containing protein [Azonexus sp.]
MTRLFFALLFTLLLAVAPVFTNAGVLDAISSSDASAGVKEALAKGADFAVSTLGQNNGFLGNAKVKIPLPGYLEKAEKGLRLIGMGKQADELVDTMNHAAENAVAEARPILSDSIKKMTVKDAKDILTGGDDSVTQYFKRSSAEQLTQKFTPIVKSATAKLKLAEKYNAYAGKAASMGLINAKDADINTYVTQKAMDGLFLIIAEEEKKLRDNPVAAGSALLKKVFGAL